MIPPWKELQPDFATLRAERGLNSLAATIGAARSSVDRWARGSARPIRVYAERIAILVGRSRASQVGPPPASGEDHPT